MIYFRPIDRDIDFLLPPSVQEWLPAGHLARYIAEVVEGLDLSNLVGAYSGRGSAPFHPATLLSLLIYGYATGCFSSRKIERATYDSLAFRYLACNRHPDHDTLATFRRRFRTEFEAVFVQVLEVARENQLSRFGSVSLDGTKIHANASRHSAPSYGHAETIEAQLKGEVQQLLALAEEADGVNVPDGMSVPEELKRREDRLAAIAAAKAKIEARAAERFAREQADYEAKRAARAEPAATIGKKVGGKEPQPPTPGPRPGDQINLTDEDWSERFSEPEALPADPTPVQRMTNRLKTGAGRAAYALRKQRVEPVFGIIKSVLGQPLRSSPAVWTMFRVSGPSCAWRGI